MSHPFAQLPPWAWLMHAGMQNNQAQQQQVPDIIVPARVNKALEFLGMITHKTQKRPVAVASESQIEIEIIPGQVLSDEENNTVATACNLLANYFAGKLQPDIWESVKVEGARKQIEQNTLPGRLMHCIACQHGPPNSTCPLCNGTGRIMVSPVGSPPQPGDIAE